MPDVRTRIASRSLITKRFEHGIDPAHKAPTAEMRKA
jgi:hypothetical protein